MVLKAIKYRRSKDEKSDWSIEGKPVNGQYSQWLTFEHITLVVGKNASGKSKTLQAIRQIADLLAGDAKLPNLIYDTAVYELLFQDNTDEIIYYLSFKDAKVLQEVLKINGIEKLNRLRGELYYEELNTKLAFKTDDDKLALSRRDSKQQPFFENLYLWGKNLTDYKFGGQLGKNAWVRDVNVAEDDKDISLKDTDKVVSILLQGKKLYKEVFTEMIISDMKTIGYDIKDVDVKPLNLKFLSASPFGLGVQERGLDDFTDQREMSQGMFRALSLLVQINYSLLTKMPSCILIDDIGEGLDYDRSKSLIDLIIEKIKNSAIQVIMTTNDRFVMNKIPLDYWSVIQRIKNKSLFYNYQNSKETFDDFKYTGLNNFDFLSTEFYITGFETVDCLDYANLYINVSNNVQKLNNLTQKIDNFLT